MAACEARKVEGSSDEELPRRTVRVDGWATTGSAEDVSTGDVSRPTDDATSATAPSTPEVDSFVRRALGLRLEMRFKDESRWWPVDTREVAETLAGYYYDYGMHSCLEMMREGRELPTALAYFRVRR